MRILVVEDDPGIMALIKDGFEAEAFAVDAAEDGERGSYLARVNDYDAIVLDLMLPKKDGYTICKEIRESGKTSPILMLSVHAATQSKVDILNDGADDYMTKPFSFDELLARVRALMRRPYPLEPETYSIGDLVIDTRKQTVTRGTTRIYLTRKEFCLLEYLARNRGTVVSRSMIMEHVWSSESNPFSNTIEAHILNLRRKLDGGKRKPLLHTVPGRGYKLDIEA